MTWAFGGLGNAALPGFADDDFLVLVEKDENFHDTEHFFLLVIKHGYSTR